MRYMKKLSNLEKRGSVILSFTSNMKSRLHKNYSMSVILGAVNHPNTPLYRATPFATLAGIIQVSQILCEVELLLRSDHCNIPISEYNAQYFSWLNDCGRGRPASLYPRFLRLQTRYRTCFIISGVHAFSLWKRIKHDRNLLETRNIYSIPPLSIFSFIILQVSISVSTLISLLKLNFLETIYQVV